MVYKLMLHFIALTRDGNDYVNFIVKVCQKVVTSKIRATSDVLTRSMTEL